MPNTAEPRKTSGTEALAVLHERLSLEMRRHADAVTAIQREMQGATRKGARSLIESGQGDKIVRSRKLAAKQERELTAEQKGSILADIRYRLSRKVYHYKRPEGINFVDVQRALEADPVALWSLWKMEETGGEPDIVAVEDDAFVFADCSAESPPGRRNCVYDKKAERSARDAFDGNAVDMAEEFGVEMWSSKFYRQMQRLGTFDRITWSWLKTDAKTMSVHGPFRGHHGRSRVDVDGSLAHWHSDDGAWRGFLRVQKA